MNLDPHLKSLLQGTALAMLGIATVHAQNYDDYGFFRPGANLWRAQLNLGGSPPDIDGTAGDFTIAGSFGNSSTDDAALVGDVDGDGAADRVIFNSGTREWTWDKGNTATFFGDGVAEAAAAVFGQAGDVGLLGDVNGDGFWDRVLFRLSDETWHVDFSSAAGFGDGTAETMGGNAFYDAGGPPIQRVMLSDYNGDGIADRSIFSGGNFFRSFNPGGAAWSDGTDSDSVGVGLGNGSFIPPKWVGDFDGDGSSDNIAWNGIGNSTVFSRLSSTVPPWSDSVTVLGSHFGDPNQDTEFFCGDFNATIVPPGEIERDGVGDDIGMYRPATGAWTVSFNPAGAAILGAALSDAGGNPIFGGPTELSLVGDINGDGLDDRIVVTTTTLAWRWDAAPEGAGFGDGLDDNGSGTVFGQSGDLGLIGDINGDGFADRVVFRAGDGSWHVDFSNADGFGDGVEEVMAGDVVYNVFTPQIGNVMLGDWNGDGIDDRTIFSAGLFGRTLGAGGADWGPFNHDAPGSGLGNSAFKPSRHLGDIARAIQSEPDSGIPATAGDPDGQADLIALAGGGTVFCRPSPGWLDGDQPLEERGITITGTYPDAVETTDVIIIGDFNSLGIAPPLNATRNWELY